MENTAANSQHMYMTSLSEMSTVCTITSAELCAVKSVKALFARPQHFFDIAAKLIDVDSNFLSHPALLQGRFYVGAGGAQAPPNVGQAPPNILVPTAKIRILKI